jgi:hypothetical protein
MRQHVARRIVLLALLATATLAQAETWKMVASRKSDDAPLYVDIDYLVEHGRLIEFRAKIKVEKNLFTLLLPTGEVEDRYVVDCDSKKIGLVYQKTTKGTDSTVERDAVPSAVSLVDIPPLTMLVPASDWACSERSKKLAARQPPSPSSAQPVASAAPPQAMIPDDVISRGRWKLIAPAVPDTGTDEIYDSYIAEDSVTGGENGLYGFLARGDYRPKGTPATSTQKIHVTYWALGCAKRKLLVVEAVEFDSRGNVTRRYPFDEKNQAIDVQEGTVGATFYEYVCKTSLAKSPPKASDPQTAPNISFGTAWLSDRGYFVTAYHVVEGAGQVAIRSSDGQVYSAKVVATDKPNDIAILLSSAAASNIGLPIARALPGLGARVFTIGYPHPDLMGVSQKLTSGDVSSLSGLGDDPRLLQISTPVQSGNSGGPLLNMTGEVVGLISAKLSASQVLSKTGDLPENVNYAVKARYVAGLLEDLSPQPTLPGSKFGKQPTLEEVASGAKHAIFLIVAQ